ncbi:MAG: DUF58 domain-containing protein [Hyphomicrobiaceae bacterium]
MAATASAGASSADRQGGMFALETEAHALADRLPELLLDAIRVASTIAYGTHGRRRAGPGETFWQFRQFQSSDAATLIDWRRSASSDHLFVREREWEAAHTVWLWPDLSPSMNFKSPLAPTTKRDRALVLMLAAAELLVRGGERVGLLGLTRASASRNATTRLAEALAVNADGPVLTASLPPQQRLARFTGLLLFSDFLDPLDAVVARLNELSAGGVSGHLIQILDPAEETLPYRGRTEFLGLEGDGRWLSDRAESLRTAYQARLQAHRAGIAEAARRLDWSFLVHHTDRGPAEPLLSLFTRLQDGMSNYRLSGAASWEGKS